MSEPKRYQPVVQCVEPSYQAQMIEPKVMEFSEGEYVLHSDYARLKAEVERWKEASENYRLMLQDRQAHLDAERKYIERLTEAGDAMYNEMLSPKHPNLSVTEAWNAAKGVHS